jgi:2-haloacid dehalogenase
MTTEVPMLAGAVDTVIFDLGGVLIDWDPRHLYRKIFGEDELEMERFLREVCNAAWNLSMDAGRPFGEAVAELIVQHPHERERIEAYHKRWIEMIAGPITGTVAILEKLAADTVPLYAITNWSAETFALVRSDPLYGFLDHFREIFVSGTLRMIKPEPEIFHHALARIGRPAGACLFIDDATKNIAAAAALGLAVHRFTSPDVLAADLRTRGLLS